MIVDTSAVLAIYLDEPEGDLFLDAILQADRVAVSAATYVEICLKVDRGSDGIGREAFDDLFAKLGLEVVPVTEAQARVARRANLMYGRGSGHPARLNYGDCFSYALAKERDQPLLFKGDDFVHTDVKRR